MSKQARTYSALVSITITSPEGLVLGTKSEEVRLTLDKAMYQEVGGTPAAADSHMKEEIGELLSAAASNVEECFD